MKTALTVAGSDPSGGAGIQADIKTMLSCGVYAMSVITALTAQNTTGVYGIQNTDTDFLALQLNCVFEDIFPDAVKIGMVPSYVHAKIISEKLKLYGAKNVVTDPVMVSTSGSSLTKNSDIHEIAKLLFPLSVIITPNIPEAQALSGMTISTHNDMENAAKAIHREYGCDVLIKGGHSINDANDFLYGARGGKWFEGIRINNPNTHGTGCTLSSAIASRLAAGDDIFEAVDYAKKYISRALARGLDLGKGRGPLNHKDF